MMQAWADALRDASRRRGMRFVGGIPFVLDDVYLSSLDCRVVRPDRESARLRVDWTASIKPLAVDDVLWRAFMPDVEMGAQMRINRRVNGAFQIHPMRIAGGSREFPAGDIDPEPILDEFETARSAFVARRPGVADFVTALEEDSRYRASNWWLEGMVAALIAAGRASEAARLADDAIAGGKRGTMASTVDVLKYLSAYAKGPDAYAAFRQSLEPTHDLEVIAEVGQSVSVDLSSAHHKGRFGHHLSALDGSDRWAVVLSARPPAGAPEAYSTLAYVQAAGSAQAMTVEVCRPGRGLGGIVSTRFVVGRRAGGDARGDVEIELPRHSVRVGGHEVFTADQAAEVFMSFYRSGEIPDGHELRAVEGFASDGRRIDPATGDDL